MMKHYDSYKDCGIEWIGEIPSHWEVKQIKYISEVVLGKMLTPENKGDMTLKPYLRSMNIQNDTLDLSDVNEMWFSKVEMKRLLLKKGDILLNEGGDVGRTVMWNNELDECYFQNSVNRIRLVKDNPTYIKYQSILIHKMGYYDSIVSRVSIPHLTKEKLEGVKYIVPPLSEQEHIVSYLDDKTTKIDELIQKKLRKIDLLKEYRTSLINTVVTKGLNPNVPMKDSGIEWIGEIPSHWEVTRLKRMTKVKRGSSPRPIDNPKYFDENGQFSWVRISDVTKSERYLISTEEKLSELGCSLSTKVYPNQLFLSIAGSVGKPIISKIECCIHDGFVWFDNLNFNPELLWYQFNVGTCFSGLGKMGTQLNLNSDTVGMIHFPIPPLSEQEQIVSYLDDITSQIDKTIDIEKKKIELLKEYRQSLISNVVTGKIKVIE